MLSGIRPDSIFTDRKQEERSMNQNILETKCLTKSFRNHNAVNQISLAVPKNQVYGLLGPNGAGKSTLLKMMTGILRPTDGQIIFDGHVWSRKDLADIGALVETPPIYENLTAWENLKVRGLMLGIPDGRIREVLELVDLEDTGKKKAGTFSLGMKQRLGIGIALFSRPKLLVLDEPTNGLDPIGIQELREMIRKFPEEGITVIVSSHILSDCPDSRPYRDHRKRRAWIPGRDARARPSGKIIHGDCGKEEHFFRSVRKKTEGGEINAEIFSCGKDEEPSYFYGKTAGFHADDFRRSCGVAYGGLFYD